MMNIVQPGLALVLTLLAALAGPAWAGAAALEEPLARIRAVGREGAGNEEARKAWQEVAAAKPDALPKILAAMDGADAVASNWLRVAVEGIADRARKEKAALPAPELELFIKDVKHSPGGRRLAYDLLVQVDKFAPDRLLPGMLLDPAAELRRDAVARVIGEGQKLLDKGEKDAAKAAFQKALTGACDQDQVKDLAAKLKPLGVEVDLARHFGFIQNWYLAAAFDNTRKVGFKEVYPPEKGVDLKAGYEGKGKAKVGWVPEVTRDAEGKLDLNKVLGKQKGVVGYAFAVIDSPVEQPVEVRVGTFNAIKIYLNGKEIFAREEYHHGMRFDGNIGTGTLKAGRNEVLLKVCQNEQTEDWAQSWIFQARLTNATGAAIPFSQAPVKPETKPN